jgi:ABC-2 type transport system ATP-binding protein
MRRLGERKTILLSTHILQEVQAMASRVVMIHEGQLVFDGAVNDLVAGNATLEDAFCQMTATA